MARYTTVPSKTFEQELSKLSPVDQKRVVSKIAFLENNPFHPSLRTKRLHRMLGHYESSVSMGIRIIWCYEDSNAIQLIDIGPHDLLRKY